MKFYVCNVQFWWDFFQDFFSVGGFLGISSINSSFYIYIIYMLYVYTHIYIYYINITYIYIFSMCNIYYMYFIYIKITSSTFMMQFFSILFTFRIALNTFSTVKSLNSATAFTKNWKQICRESFKRTSSQILEFEGSPLH